ncbi:MAG: hypothetical protein Q7S73_00135 [bacterium]|nr:hypothetical protein [bacterium]
MADRTAADKIAKILRADKQALYKIEDRLSRVTGQTGVFEKIVKENEQKVKEKLLTLGVSRDSSAKEVYDALISKIESDDYLLLKAFGGLVCDNSKDCNQILEIARKIAESNHGFFLKLNKAKEFLIKEPPKKVMEYLGYDSPEKMVEKENLFELYSALRFLEGSEWLNQIFFKQYENLTPDDFEIRELVVHSLDQKWVAITEKFVVKKKHNISHLKELGVVFVIPISLGISGELLRMLSLVFHYLHEIPFYSDIFKKIAEVPETFSENCISLLRGDVIAQHLSESPKSQWLVVQRYLAKDDENDWRLFAPHLNPEALHWDKASQDLIMAADMLSNRNKKERLSPELSFWNDLDWVGDYFKDDVGNEVLVSFNLVDTVMSLVKEKEMVKYLYHHQEALWNKIFMGYFSKDELEKFAKEYLLQGYFEI